MLFQVYFKRTLNSSEWGCLPEHCRTLQSLLNSDYQTTIINAEFGNYVFAQTGSQSVPKPDGFRMPCTSPANSVLQGEQTSQWPDHPFKNLGGYTIAGIIIQEENVLLPSEYQEDGQQVSSIYVHFFLVLFIQSDMISEMCAQSHCRYRKHWNLLAPCLRPDMQGMPHQVHVIVCMWVLILCSLFD